ncbi:MAG: fructose-specific PTS transporter subunit EIIC [Lachnospiraceae bacterium]|jgi:PTS system fructose-specific IIC component|nr:fructose-specific PTS transporter subunit EIIC [Lachnospiraceae bacterium]MCI1328592.1 fructose-specific PTS transporter subunit EIIC [Lachnospiraceae bacterium]
MKIRDLLKVEGIRLGASATDKENAIDQLVDLQVASGNISDREKYKEGILAREAESTTAMGDGIAIPHAKVAAVKRAGLVAMTVPDGVDYDAPDGEPSDLFFMIAAPEGANDVHLEVLSRLAEMLMDDDFTDNLRAARTPEEFLAVIDAAESEKQEQEEEKAAAAASGINPLPDVLAVTACPTGIAHTYMAAENLEKTAKEMGVRLKAETQGSVGAKNVLTAEEIAHAKGIIIAADKNIDLSRFKGKQVYQCSVSKGINEPEVLINKILNDEAPLLEGTADASDAASGEKDSVWHTIYKNLMNGVSHMLPFVVGGGILIALSFLIDTGSIGQSFYGQGNAAAKFFNQIGNVAFSFMLPVLAGFIAMSIADRPGLAVGFVGGWIAKEGFTFAYLADQVNVAVNGAEPTVSAVSAGFLGALLAGFIAGYLTLGLEKLCDRMPSALEGIKPVLIYPLIGILCIGFVMCGINPIMGAINSGITGLLNSMGTGNLTLLGGVVGGMEATDMGGPINKAAYLFGTGMLEGGTDAGQSIMASVMAGGMVPPILIALSTTFFKNRWTSEERKAGVVNYIMGLSFITEGAIPYAAADPGHVIPSCIVGSALAGALSAAWGCTSPAPHGGIWVIAVIHNPAGYIAAILIGAVAGALLLSLWKKKLPPEKSGLAA